MKCDTIWRDAHLATMVGAGLGEIEHGLVACRNGRIVYAGPADGAPALEPEQVVDCKECWITPGLVDPHTHLVYAGDRAAEFERRLAGASYEEIARDGGGIVSTVRATRAASEPELIAASAPRLEALMAEGVTTVEIKSGYGLSVADELKQLRAARALQDGRQVSVVTTLLAAHAVPPEFKGQPDRYIDLVCGELIPAAATAGLADAVDAFCESIAFTPAQIERVFAAAKAKGLPIKLHAEQLSNQNGAALAARYGALSADHLEHLDEAGVQAMAKAGTTAVLLPGAYYFMRETQLPPLARLREAGVPLALATDCNPGTAPLTSPLLVMNLAATLFRMTVPECLLGLTREAARAIGRLHEIGTLEIGKRCDLAIWRVDRLAELVYRMGANPLRSRIWGGLS